MLEPTRSKPDLVDARTSPAAEFRFAVTWRAPTYAWSRRLEPDLERKEIGLLFRRLLPFTSGSLFLDVGAHFGYFAAVFDAEMVAANRDGKVIAVEPDPDAFFCLQKTVSASRISTTCVQAAVGRERGVTTLHRGSGTCLHTYPRARIGGTRQHSSDEHCRPLRVERWDRSRADRLRQD